MNILFVNGYVDSHLTPQAIRDLQGDPSAFEKFGVSDPVGPDGQPNWQFVSRAVKGPSLAHGASEDAVFVVEEWYDPVTNTFFQFDYSRASNGFVDFGHLRTGPR